MARYASKKEQIEDSYTYHPPRDGQAQLYEQIRNAVKELALMIEEVVPDGRYKALAQTALEESNLWANKAIALDSE